MNKLQKALQVAAIAHAGQVRRGTNIPYIVHPVGVMMFAQNATDDEDTLVACLLHDVLEDGGSSYSEAQMLRDFGYEITTAVKSVSKDESIPSWRGRNEDYLTRLEAAQNKMALVVCAADKMHNLTAILDDHAQVGDELWKRFHASKEDVLWWYESVTALLMRNLANVRLVDELAAKVASLREIVYS